ncbi:DedA family protein [Actinoplanes sp. CA-252034]|uniref:DedA family protein n=1 Tax=Actinoplanes sp. CA-252034 TaxID=3239906 RepID=UPI003D950E42
MAPFSGFSGTRTVKDRPNGEDDDRMMDHLTPLICSPWLYVIVFVAVTVDGFFPIVPSETVVISLGALSATGSPHLLALVAVVVAGGVAGDRVSCVIGRKAGTRMSKGKLAAARQRAERALRRYGAVTILVGRFLPYGRTATGMMSGSVRMPVGRFSLYSTLASLGWAVYVIGLGRLGGMAFSDSPLLGTAFGLLIGMSLAGVCALAERRWTAARRRRTPVPAGRPLPASLR